MHEAMNAPGISMWHNKWPTCGASCAATAARRSTGKMQRERQAYAVAYEWTSLRCKLYGISCCRDMREKHRRDAEGEAGVQGQASNMWENYPEDVAAVAIHNATICRNKRLLMAYL